MGCALAAEDLVYCDIIKSYFPGLALGEGCWNGFLLGSARDQINSHSHLQEPGMFCKTFTLIQSSVSVCLESLPLQAERQEGQRSSGWLCSREAKGSLP